MHLFLGQAKDLLHIKMAGRLMSLSSLKRLPVLQTSLWFHLLMTSALPTDLSFDLSPLAKADGGFYNLTSGSYDYFINVCGPVKASNCPEKTGACQVEQKTDGTAAM